jgi:purine-binding chemotaxis protein CheW
MRMTRLRGTRASVVRTFVACEVGKTFYALPVEQVQEITQPLPLTHLPHAPPGVIGAVEHRDQVVPILDLGWRLGYGETSSQRRKWVLVKGRGQIVGVVVSQVHEVFEVATTQLRPAPEVGDSAARAATHVLTYRDKMAFVLSMESVAGLATLALRDRHDE